MRQDSPATPEENPAAASGAPDASTGPRDARAPNGHAVPEAADEPLPDASPASHTFSKEAMIIEPPTFQEMPDLGDMQTQRFWNLLWFNFGRPILIGGLWLSCIILGTHIALNWSDMPHGVLAVAAAIASLLLLASILRRYAKQKPRKSTERVHGSEIAAFFGTDKDAHRTVRHSKRIDAWFDGSRVALVSEKQADLVEGKLPFTAKGPDGRPLRVLNPGSVAAARAAGFPGAKAEPVAAKPPAGA